MPLCSDTTASAPKRAMKARFQLRRQVDLGHHHQRLRLRVAGQQGLHRLQVHLGLAAAGGAVDQERARLGRDLSSACACSGVSATPLVTSAGARCWCRRLRRLRRSRRASCRALRPRSCGGSAASATSPTLRW
jgi:hypothetical protein